VCCWIVARNVVQEQTRNDKLWIDTHIQRATHARPILPRDAMRKRGLLLSPGIRLSVRLSVRQSVTFVHSIQTAEDIVKLLVRPGSPIPNSKENPFSGGAKYKGWEIFAIFNGNRRLSRKRYEIGPWLLWNVNRKSYALYRMVTFSMTFTDLVFKVTAFLKSNIS